MTVSSRIKVKSLLTKDDPRPVEIVNGHSDHPLLLVCEHAGQEIPTRLENLGIGQTTLECHIGWDIGAEAVTQAIAHDLDAAARAARVEEIFTPFDSEVASLYEKFPRRIVLSIHSFTPTMDGVHRPWEIGFLFRDDTETSAHLGQFVREANPELTIGMNEPYQIDDASDWFVPRHGEARGIPHSLIEIRNDQIQTAKGQAHWAGILANAANRYLKEV